MDIVWLYFFLASLKCNAKAFHTLITCEDIGYHLFYGHASDVILMPESAYNYFF